MLCRTYSKAFHYRIESHHGLAALALGLSRFVRLRRCEPAEGGVLLVRDAIQKRRLGLGQFATEVGGVV
jgi:hypothetical protein